MKVVLTILMLVGATLLVSTNTGQVATQNNQPVITAVQPVGDAGDAYAVTTDGAATFYEVAPNDTAGFTNDVLAITATTSCCTDNVASHDVIYNPDVTGATFGWALTGGNTAVHLSRADGMVLAKVGTDSGGTLLGDQRGATTLFG